MTSALIPLAASSLIALSAGAPGGGHARQATPAAQDGSHQGRVAQQAPTRMNAGPRGNVAGARPDGQRAAHARTAPDGAHDSGGHASPDSGASNNGGQTDGGGDPGGSNRAAPARTASSHHASPDNHGQPHQQASRNPPPRGSSSHAAPASRPSSGPRPGYRPPPRYSPWDPTPHRVYVDHHYHVAPWQPAYWSAGVFVYAAPPPQAAGARRAPAQARATAPARDVDRSNSLSVGLRSGSFMSSYEGGASYGDFGVGVTARYRANEAIGLEASYGYFSDTFTADSERVSQPMSASVELFAFPWTKVSPYMLGGVTWTARSYNDTYTSISGAEEFTAKDLQFGPHGGVGLELAAGENASLNLEGRYTHFVTHSDDDNSAPGALQGLVGVNLYF